jgi:hypothetical protein
MFEEIVVNGDSIDASDVSAMVKEALFKIIERAVTNMDDEPVGRLTIKMEYEAPEHGCIITMVQRSSDSACKLYFEGKAQSMWIPGSAIYETVRINYHALEIAGTKVDFVEEFNGETTMHTLLYMIEKPESSVNLDVYLAGFKTGEIAAIAASGNKSSNE